MMTKWRNCQLHPPRWQSAVCICKVQIKSSSFCPSLKSLSFFFLSSSLAQSEHLRPKVFFVILFAYVRGKVTCVLCIHLRLLLRGGKGEDFEMGNRFCERGQTGGKKQTGIYLHTDIQTIYKHTHTDVFLKKCIKRSTNCH